MATTLRMLLWQNELLFSLNFLWIEPKIGVQKLLFATFGKTVLAVNWVGIRVFGVAIPFTVKIF